MDRQEIKDLLMQVKVCYPRFESVEKTNGEFVVNPVVVDSWYRRLGYMDYTQALKILDTYMTSENGTRIPSMNLWVTGGKVQQRSVRCTAVFDRKKGAILWWPEEGNDTPIERPVFLNPESLCWEDEDGYCWSFAEDEKEEPIMTQHERILSYMQKYGSITPMDAFMELGITKLATRVGELKQDGHKISGEMVNATNRFGNKVRFMRYQIVEEEVKA